MKIFDCFMYHNEDLMLDIRLNTLSKYVDQFVLVESMYDHQGNKKKLNFSYDNFESYKDRITYLVIEKFPDNMSSWDRENYQRNYIMNGLEKADLDDYVLISDVDEIPDLTKFKLIKNFKYSVFKQKMYYYKFNLLYENFEWIGSKACRKKSFISPQWLRDTKNKKYPFWRLDTFFNKNKYTNVTLINNGGWHFTQIKSSADIFSKLNTFAHHEDFKGSGLNQNDINKAVKEKKILYDHSADKDMHDHKWIGKKTLKSVKVDTLPKYIIDNQNKFKDWIDS